MIERTPQRAYLDLQKLAREQGRNTQQLFELYVHERFLARLAESRFADKFVLKGGMLLAVLDVRRGTRDADMLARDLASDESNLRTVIGEIYRQNDRGAGERRRVTTPAQPHRHSARGPR